MRIKSIILISTLLYLCCSSVDTSDRATTGKEDDSDGRVTESTTTGKPDSSTGGSNTGACGEWQNGCPDDMFCVELTETKKTCACRREKYIYDSNIRQCIPNCRAFDPVSYYDPDERKCVCKDGYTADSTVNSNPFVRCVPKDDGNPNTCANVRCEYGYYCKDLEEGPTCVRDPSVAVCGVSFKCPDPDRFICRDTSLGPKCFCAPGFSGPRCDLLACDLDDTATDVCPENSDCSYDRTSPSPYCKCRPGWTGIRCDVPTDKCNNVECTDPNTVCKEGRCVCEDGYLPTCEFDKNRPDNSACSCKPVDEDICEEECTGNFQCTEVSEGEGKCICPFEQFGSRECNRPRCREDKDCRLENAYCVINTRPDVPPFCSCRYGWTGPYCNTSTTCSRDSCGQNQVCSNEGLCICKNGYTGPRCEDKIEQGCRRIEVFLRINAETGEPFSADEVKKIIVDRLQVDAGDITIEGPFDTKDPRVKRYIVIFCPTENIDPVRNEEAFETYMQAGNIGGLEFTSDPDAGSNASFVKVCYLVTVASLLISLL